MATIKKPAKKMQEGGKVKIKIKIKPDRKQAREAREDKDKMSLNRKAMEDAMKNPLFEADKASKDAGFNKAKAMKKGGVVKAKNGKSFPDLNKDGKITKADILKGRGVIAKSGAKLKKQAAVAIAMKKAGKAPKKMQYGGAAASMVPPMMKKGGKMKKAQSGASFKNITDMFGRSGGFDGGMRDQMAASILKKKTQKPQAGGSSFLSKPTMKKGGATKKCKYGCK